MPYLNDEFDEFDPDYPEPDLDEHGSEMERCPACNAWIYADAEQCPSCGEYVSPGKDSRKPWWVVLGAVVLLIVIILFWI